MALFDIFKRKKSPDFVSQKKEKEQADSKEKVLKSSQAEASVGVKTEVSKKTSSDKRARETKHPSLKSAESKAKKALKPGSLRIDQTAAGGERLASVILRPRITEKASYITADGAYTFNVLPRANKIQIKNAIQEIFGVKPIKVNIVVMKPKRITVRNKKGFKARGKKAIVYLKEGDRIEYV